MKEVTKNPIKGTLRLKNPILINGNEITEVTYDSNEIDGILFATAESRRKAAAGRKDISIAPAAEFDFAAYIRGEISSYEGPQFTFMVFSPATFCPSDSAVSFEMIFAFAVAS